MTSRPYFLTLLVVLLLSLFTLQACDSSSPASEEEAFAVATTEANVEIDPSDQNSDDSTTPTDITDAPGTQDPAPGNTPERTKQEDIRRLMAVLQADQLGDQIIQQMLAMMRQENPNLPADFMNRFSESIDASELVELLIPIYDRHLSHEDIIALTEFYLSEPGQNFIAVQGQISHEAMMAGQQWGQQTAMKVMNELQKQ